MFPEGWRVEKAFMSTGGILFPLFHVTFHVSSGNMDALISFGVSRFLPLITYCLFALHLAWCNVLLLQLCVVSNVSNRILEQPSSPAPWDVGTPDYVARGKKLFKKEEEFRGRVFFWGGG